MANGEHVEEKRLIGGYIDVERRALLEMIKDMTGENVTGMINEMIETRCMALGILDANRNVVPEFKFAFDGMVVLTKERDQQRKKSGK